MPSLRTLLVLGRVSNLPTVWSNCLAGWWLGGGVALPRLIFVMAGASLIHTAGMYLNDAFDVDFDAEHRRERPIPSGKITIHLVWRIGFALLGAGVVVLFGCGMMAGVIGVLLAALVIFYNLIHKAVNASPVVMGACRFLLYPLAASIVPDGLNGWAVWCGFAVGCYVAGLSFLARGESRRAKIPWWPCVFLAAPVALGLFMNRHEYFENALLLGFASLLWSVMCLRRAYAGESVNLALSIAGLMAGIVLVDLLAALDVSRPVALVFLALLGLCVLLQRLVPAT